MAFTRPAAPQRAIEIWLYVCCALVFAMVLLGGITRLTESGLSIVDWRPVTGWLPPMSDLAWAALFDAYRESPEFRRLNFWMGLEDFKRIFWLEYLHRLLGRIIGIVYFIPFLWFVLRYRLPPGLSIRLAGLFVLGGLQGALGWYMVKSGLVEEPSVSQYRLAAHLGLAVVIYGAMLYIAAGLRPRAATAAPAIPAGRLAVLVFVTMIWGAFVSGLDGGAVFNTFPLMDGRLIPPGALSMTPIWLNPFENIGTVQFIHRTLAILTVALILWTWWRHRQTGSRTLSLVAIFAVLQLCLGIATILTGASLYIAWAHQAGGMLVFSAAVWLWWECA
jgi:cytochrome c oxidase assembly protein subunit 15